MREFETEIARCKNVMPIDLGLETRQKIDEFTRAALKVKEKESHHISDPAHNYQRIYTGMMGECAVEQYLQQSFVDWSIGDSMQFDHADLIRIGLNVGVKTVEHGKFHVIHKKSIRPEILCLKESESRILILGIASVKTLTTFQDEDLILSPYLRKRGTKTGFYGYGNLQSFHGLFDLEESVIRIKDKIFQQEEHL